MFIIKTLNNNPKQWKAMENNGKKSSLWHAYVMLVLEATSHARLFLFFVCLFVCLFFSVSYFQPWNKILHVKFLIYNL